jgi:hypothetical protein
MQVLKEYITLIETFEFKKGEKEALLGNGDTKLAVFYDGILKGKYPTDAVAAKMLYNKKTNHAPYKALKSDLKKRLAQLVFIIDFKKTDWDGYTQAYYDGWKNWSMVNILYRWGKYTASIDAAENLLEYAKNFGLTEFIVNTSYLLTHLYAHQLHDEVKMREMMILYTEHLSILEIENKAEFYYFEITSHFIKSKLIPSELRETTKKYLSIIHPYLNQHNTIRLQMLGRLLQIYDHFCRYEYAAVIQVADSAIAFFKEKGFAPERYIALFLHQKAKAQLQLGQYEEGITFIRISLESEPIGTHNWFNRGFTLMKLYLFTEQYQNAWRFFKVLIDNLDNQKQVQVLMEEFRIYEVFMQFLVATKHIKLGEEDDDAFTRPYDPVLFSKSLLFLSKDKMGMNISIQIIQLLHALIEQSKKNKTRDIENEIMERIASLEYYRNAYLKKSENVRHDLFVKLINQAVKGHFRTKRVYRHSQEDLETLRTQKGAGDIYADMGSEVFKHETTWAFMGKYWD